jgi:hypothetical protein
MVVSGWAVIPPGNVTVGAHKYRAISSKTVHFHPLAVFGLEMSWPDGKARIGYAQLVRRLLGRPRASLRLALVRSTNFRSNRSSTERKSPKDKPAIGSVRPQQRAVAARGDLAYCRPLAHPWSKLGTKVDVDIVVQVTKAKHGHAQRLAHPARRAVGRD